MENSHAFIDFIKRRKRFSEIKKTKFYDSYELWIMNSVQVVRQQK